MKATGATLLLPKVLFTPALVPRTRCLRQCYLADRRTGQETVACHAHDVLRESNLQAGRFSRGPAVAASLRETGLFAFRLGPATFGIFDTFSEQQGRSAHVNGEVAKALFARAEELFVTAPQIQMADIVAEKL